MSDTPRPAFTGTADDLTQADKMILHMLRGTTFTNGAVLVLPSGRAVTPEKLAELRTEMEI